MNNTQKLPVAISAAGSYNTEEIIQIIEKHFEIIGVDTETFKNKKVVIKPNLIMKKAPEYAATTSPEILDGVLTYLDKCDCENVTIAESSGGPYTKQSLEAAYNVCGIKAVAEKHKVDLNYDTSYTELANPEGKIVKSFNVITPVANADIIINLPRLKSHSLTGMSAAAKNYFGVVPGLQKFEFHARFPDYNDFSAMLVDLASCMMKNALTVNILDAIVGMEGNGPTGGTPRKIGCILTSTNPFAIDTVARELISAGEVLTVKESAERGFTSLDADEINLAGDDYKNFIVKDFKQPDSRRRRAAGVLTFFSSGKIGEFFRPRPVISKRCIGCGECERSCPKTTISMKQTKGGKRVADINLDKCIRCFCCQELCPIHAIDVKKNGLVAIVNMSKKNKGEK